MGDHEGGEKQPDGAGMRGALKFFFHGVVPAAVRKDLSSGIVSLEAQKMIPSQVLLPGGHVAVGTITGESALAFHDAAPSLLPASPFVVVSAPLLDHHDARRKRRLFFLFAALILADFALLTYNTAAAAAAAAAAGPAQSRQVLPRGSSSDVLVGYFSSVAVLALGLYGARTDDVLFLSFFLITTLVSFFVGIMFAAAATAIVHLILQILLCRVALSYRAFLLFTWQTTRVA